VLIFSDEYQVMNIIVEGIAIFLKNFSAQGIDGFKMETV